MGDDEAAVARNRRLLEELLPSPPFWLSQAHTPFVMAARTPHGAADGAFTCEPKTALAVLTADCLPVFFCDREGKAVALAHAGWRGLAQGILENTVAAMRENPKNLISCLGPAIEKGRYLVGEDVYLAFTGKNQLLKEAFSPQGKEHWLCDLKAIARLILESLGVQVFDGGHDTGQEELFYSYRREGRTGRFASLIWMEKP